MILLWSTCPSTTTFESIYFLISFSPFEGPETDYDYGTSFKRISSHPLLSVSKSHSLTINGLARRDFILNSFNYIYFIIYFINKLGTVWYMKITFEKWSMYNGCITLDIIRLNQRCKSSTFKDQLTEVNRTVKNRYTASSMQQL